MGRVSLDIIQGDNLEVLKSLSSSKVQLIYTDPPFNTKKEQHKVSLKMVPSEVGERKGYKDKLYKAEVIGDISYNDTFEDLSKFLYPRIEECNRILTPNGSIFIHLDYREIHDVKVKVMDPIFGKSNFMNEIIWAYDYGAKPKNRWPAKHDTILWYVKDSNDYIFNYNQMDRVPYMAPSLVTEEKASKGKILTDVWWNTIVCGKEKTGYPTQKPVALLERIVKVHSNPEGLLLDLFAGSGTFGQAAISYGRSCILIDEKKEAIEIMEKRFSNSQLFCDINISKEI